MAYFSEHEINRSFHRHEIESLLNVTLEQILNALEIHNTKTEYTIGVCSTAENTEFTFSQVVYLCYIIELKKLMVPKMPYASCCKYLSKVLATQSTYPFEPHLHISLNKTYLAHSQIVYNTRLIHFDCETGKSDGNINKADYPPSEILFNIEQYLKKIKSQLFP